jgi:hypothetical protein
MRSDSRQSKSSTSANCNTGMSQIADVPNLFLENQLMYKSSPPWAAMTSCSPAAILAACRRDLAFSCRHALARHETAAPELSDTAASRGSTRAKASSEAPAALLFPA